MNPVEPKLSGTKLRIAESQPQYQPVTVIRTDNPAYRIQPDRLLEPDNTVIMAFQMSEAERQSIINGERTVYVALLTFGRPQQPILVTVGPERMAELHDLQVERSPAADPLDDEVEWPVRPTTVPTNSEGLEQL